MNDFLIVNFNKNDLNLVKVKTPNDDLRIAYAPMNSN
jgi:hypothetical protein